MDEDQISAVNTRFTVYSNEEANSKMNSFDFASPTVQNLNEKPKINKKNEKLM